MIKGSGWKPLCVLFVVGMAAQAHAQFVKCVTNFSTQEGFAAGNEVLLQEPRFSGSTAGIVIGQTSTNPPVLYDDTQVVEPTGDWCPGGAAGCLSDNAYEIYFPWATPAESIMTSGVRLTTLNVLNLPSPSIHLEGKIRFNMAVTAFSFEGDVFPDFPIGFQDQSGNPSILMCLGIRETGRDLPQGATDTGGGDLEYVYLPLSQVVPAADTNGLIPFPPGGRRFNATTNLWPPEDSAFVSVEFDLGALTAGQIRGFANNGDGINTAGDGVLDATLNPSGDGVNRGTLESIIFTNDPADTTTEYFFIYIDDIEFEAPEPDTTIARPSIAPPVFSNDTTVEVNTLFDACDGTDVTSVGLYINGSLVDDSPDSIANGLATFSGLTLSAGNVLTARQAKDGVKSPFSLPVTVYAPGVIFADDFDSYTTQAELNQVWSNSINTTVPPTARVRLVQNSAASCENVVMEDNPAGSDGARAYRFIGSVNGTDAEPLWVTWHYQHKGASSFGARFRFELARFAGDTFSATFGARLSGTTGIILENGPSTIPLPQTLNEYNILLVGAAGTNGFFDGNQTAGTAGEVANTGVARGDNEWHKMQIEVRSNTINYYIDDVLANPVDTNGLPLWPGGVPRPNLDPYNFIVIGQGFSNNGPQMLIDNVQVTQGSTSLPFGPPNPVSSPTVSGSYLPGATTVTVVNVDSNASEVAVFVNGIEVVSTNGAGAFLDNTAVVTVPALGANNTVQATQTVGGTESCLSAAVVVTVPVPTVNGPLVPGQTTVNVSNINEGLASAVAVYRDDGGGSLTLLGSVSSPATDPVSVPVTALQNGWSVRATQTITAESAVSAAVVVGVPTVTVVAPLLPGEAAVTVTNVHPAADEVEVLVNGTPVGALDVSASIAATVLVPISPSLAPSDLVRARQEIGGVVGPLSATVEVAVPMCLIAFEDDFETDTSANWNVNVRDSALLDDGTATFNWNYGANADVPPSPNGDGSTFGLRFQANCGDATGAIAAVTASPIGLSFVASNGYRLVMDWWINPNGPFPAGGAGSTQSITMGVGYDGVTPNQGTLAGDGAWFAISGEGGATRDVQAFKNAGEQFAESGQFAAGTSSVSGGAHSTNAAPASFYVNVFGNTTTPPPAQSQAPPPTFPNQTGTLLLGSAGMDWHRADITTFGTKARWAVNGVTFVTLDTTVGTSIPLDGNISIGQMDLFASIADVPAMNFSVVDNVLVLTPHTPGINGDYDNDGDVDGVDLEYFVDCLSGPGQSPDPRTGFVCSVVCTQAFDFDADGDVDLNDFAEFQVFYNP